MPPKPDQAKRERGIIRSLKRRLKVHPNSRKLRKSLDRHRKDLANLERALHPPLRVKAWGEMQKLIDAHVQEQGGNNRGAEVEKIIRANGGVPGEPWCGDTVAYTYLRAGSKSVVRSWAAVRLLERLLTFVRNPRLGHVAIYTFDHTGEFKRWLTPQECAANHVPQRSFYAGEGNTGDSGAVSDSVTGRDGVKLKIRHIDQVSSFRRVLR